MDNSPGGITVTETGAIHADGPQGVNTYRMITIRQGIALELKGLRLTRGRSCSAVATDILKEEGVIAEGKRPNKATVYRLFNDYLVSLGYADKEI